MKRKKLNLILAIVWIEISPISPIMALPICFGAAALKENDIWIAYIYLGYVALWFWLNEKFKEKGIYNF